MAMLAELVEVALDSVLSPSIYISFDNINSRQSFSRISIILLYFRHLRK